MLAQRNVAPLYLLNLQGLFGHVVLIVVVAVAVVLDSTTTTNAFSPISPTTTMTTPPHHLGMTAAAATTTFSTDSMNQNQPQVFANGYSTKLTLLEALEEATTMAFQNIPPSSKNIDLCMVSVSSLYDGQASPTIVIPTILATAKNLYNDDITIHHILGCTAAGLISSSYNNNNKSTTSTTNTAAAATIIVPVESEGIAGVSITFCILPDVHVQTFHVLADDVPDDIGRIPPDTWKRAIGLSTMESLTDTKPIVMLLSSPSFDTLDDLLTGFDACYPSNTMVGGIASTVSSLSRARLFRYNRNGGIMDTLAEGCVGVVLRGDIEAKVIMAQGTKPVGGIYRVVKGVASTIQAICLDETATQQIMEEDNDNNFSADDNTNDDDSTKNMSEAAAAYAKAAIPKPILAEANFLLRTLSDDDQASMRKAILVGLERSGGMPRTPNELARLAAGQGHRFVVQQVASAGMKDGSVTLPRGAVSVGRRLRFFVREAEFAKRELTALWMGYKKQVLEGTFTGKPAFTPSACMILTTVDRGTKFFGGKQGYESSTAAEFVPTVPCISGFFTNGVVGPLDDVGTNDSQVHSSAAAFVLFGSVSRRPIYTPAVIKDTIDIDEPESGDTADSGSKAEATTTKNVSSTEKAPRAENGELILKRREIHAGRALTVSTVEWSVADKAATPTSTLEGFMWDKETEVDRFRERVPLSNLVSQCKLSIMDPTMPKPRDFTGPILRANDFVIIPECKRMEPVTGSLRKRYDVASLVKQYVAAGVTALSINCDPVLFGGVLDDITKAREAAASAAAELSSEDGMVVPPILASDLILYPYQLYKLQLAGADAVNLLAGALAGKDLSYLTKIASSLKLQVLVTVTSTAQIETVCSLPKGSIHGLIVSNRELEDFSFDNTGEQVLSLLKSSSLSKLRSIHGESLPVLAEGRVGMIERTGGDRSAYLKELKDAGATGAIVGAGMVVDSLEGIKGRLEELRDKA